MARVALCLSFAFLFLANVIPSEAQSAAEAEESLVTVAAGAPLTVECRLRPEQPAEWQRDGAAPPPDLRAAPEAAGADARLAARLRVPHARAQHAGLYTCSRDRGHRVRVVVLPGEAPAEASPAPAPAVAPAELPELLYDVRSNFSLHCQLPNDKSLDYVWSKNGTEISQVWEMTKRFKLERGGAEFRVERALEDDFGNYSCALSGQSGEQRWAVRGRPHVKLPANTNVVEGQKLKLTCKVVGKPYPRVSWSYSNGTADAQFAAPDAAAALADSDQGVPDGTLLLAAASRAHAGQYRCSAPGAVPATTTLRVKDMYAALWPFLGICAEVFVLCAIILLYERRRTKPDLDDSDADTHDQKKS